jgi:hypothetical protein
MSEFSTPAPEAAPPPEAPPPSSPLVSGSGLPAWLPYFLLAVVPAVIVGILVYAFAGGGSGGNAANAAAVLDGFIRLGGTSEDVQSFQGKVPPGFPSDLPSYPGAKILVSFLLQASDGSNNYFVIYQTKDQPDTVLKYMQGKLDQDPWQVEGAQSSSEFTGLHFSRPDDADVQGDLSANRSDLDNKTTIYVSYQDLSPSNRSKPAQKPFVLPVSKELPPGFPSDVPIFAGKSPTTVTATYYQRQAGSSNYLVTFLTKDSQDDVIDFYKNEFRKRGWNVTDSAPSSRYSFELSIDFDDGARKLLQGSIRADSFQDDADYTQVDMLLQVSSSRGRGN